jgi:nucleotide-binding universal stress UspA family protein
MPTPRRILLATQWTDFDAGAERLATELARKLGTPLSVVVPLLSNPEYEVVAPELAAEAEAKAARGAAEFSQRAHSAAVPVEVHFLRGAEPWRDIVDEARAENADLLVTRRRGHRGFLRRLRVGDMVRQVAAHARCPTLMVPRAAQLPAQRVLTAIDVSTAFDHVVQAAAAMAAALDLPMELLVIVRSGSATAAGSAALQRATHVASAVGVQCRGSVLSGQAVALVPERMSEVRADLLVTGIPPEQAAHGRLGDAVETLVAEVSCPTLLVGAPAAA